jgi:hypothetical protein
MPPHTTPDRAANLITKIEALDTCEWAGGSPASEYGRGFNDALDAVVELIRDEHA